jgi:hypothetical protein
MAQKGISQSFLRNFCAGLLRKKTRPPSLVSLCVGVIGKHLEDIVADLGEIATNLPGDIKVGCWRMVSISSNLLKLV